MTSLVRVGRRIALITGLLLLVLVLVAGAFVGSIVYGGRTAVAAIDGTHSGMAVTAPVRIARDDRGFVHIRAQNDHDLYFAQGYATGSDRLFQIDTTRRYVLGTLSELLGPPLLRVDERSRVLDVAAIVERQYAALPTDQRALLVAFADGINAAAQHEPLPAEYRALLTGFTPWRPQDALVAGYAVTLDLADGWNDVIARDRIIRTLGPRAIDAFYSLSDPHDDTPTIGGPPATIAALPPLDGPQPIEHMHAALGSGRLDLIGSNEWIAGGAHTASGRALLANDPHLDSSIPGIWHAVDLEAPGIHVAGATLAGVPGVVLGHNEHLAWGATNGTVAAPRVFSESFAGDDGTMYRAGAATLAATVRIERFHVRFGATVERRYLTTRHGFVLEERGRVRHAVQWHNAETDVSALAAFAGLNRAASLTAARAALAAYPGPVQNFVIADDRGNAMYALAGFLPMNADWGLRVADGTAVPPSPLVTVPFDRLPHRDPSRDLIANNSNNMQYGAGYPYRLSASYSAPYRAAEIARDLRVHTRLTPDMFRAIQADTTSFAERDLARMCVTAGHATGDDRKPELRAAYAALAAFDGHMDPSSRGASVVQRLRLVATWDFVHSLMPGDLALAYLNDGPAFVTLMRALRTTPRGWFAQDDRDAFLRDELAATVKLDGATLTDPYGDRFAFVVKHPLAAFGIPWWNGPRTTAAGGNYAPSRLMPEFGQSFRAVWDAGNWDGGGFDLPLGESGEPGSPHYSDLAARYAAHALTPFPFSDAAVARATVTTLTLTP